MANNHIITLSSPAYIHVDLKPVVIENKNNYKTTYNERMEKGMFYED